MTEITRPIMSIPRAPHAPICFIRIICDWHRVRSIGQACTTGDVGRSSTGELMTCVSGKYKQVGGHGAITYYSGIAACGGNCSAAIPNKHHLCVTQTNERDNDTEGGGGYAYRTGVADNRGRWSWRYTIYKGDESANNYVVSCLTLG